MPDPMPVPTAPRLLVVAHGTASAQGIATAQALLAAVAERRPHVDVELCYLDVASPQLPNCLDGRATVLVPLLLSTGYHVQADIPAAVRPYPRTVVVRHLGPHPLLVEALIGRLPPQEPGGSTVLVGAGSSRSEAAAELAETGRLLGERLGTPVEVATMADDLAGVLRAARPPVRAATYLLAEGQFVRVLRRAAEGVAAVAPPIGVHPALVELVWLRYDAAIGQPVS